MPHHNVDPATLALLRAAQAAREAAMIAEHATCPSWAALQAAKAAAIAAAANPNLSQQEKGAKRAAVEKLTKRCRIEFNGGTPPEL